MIKDIESAKNLKVAQFEVFNGLSLRRGSVIVFISETVCVWANGLHVAWVTLCLG